MLTTKRLAAKTGHVNVSFGCVSHIESRAIRVKYSVHNWPDTKCGKALVLTARPSLGEWPRPCAVHPEGGRDRDLPLLRRPRAADGSRDGCAEGGTQRRRRPAHAPPPWGRRPGSLRPAGEVLVTPRTVQPVPCPCRSRANGIARPRRLARSGRKPRTGGGVEGHRLASGTTVVPRNRHEHAQRCCGSVRGSRGPAEPPYLTTRQFLLCLQSFHCHVNCEIVRSHFPWA